MPERLTVEMHDVMIDGFPDEGAVAFIWGGEVFTGWPLLDRDNSYPGNTSFATPEQANAAPLNVLWEASNDRVPGTFVGVQRWFRVP